MSNRFKTLTPQATLCRIHPCSYGGLDLSISCVCFFFFYQTRKRIAAIPDRRLKLVPFIPTPDASVETLFALEGRSVASVASSVSLSATVTLSRPLLDTGVVCEIAA